MRSTLRFGSCLVVALATLTFACRATPGDSGARPSAKTSEPVCESDDDCVVSCVSETDCCPVMCGCDIVRHRDAHAEIQAANEKYCADPAHVCGDDQGDCEPIEEPTPRCIEGQCRAEPAG